MNKSDKWRRYAVFEFPIPINYEMVGYPTMNSVPNPYPIYKNPPQRRVRIRPSYFSGCRWWRICLSSEDPGDGVFVLSHRCAARKNNFKTVDINLVRLYNRINKEGSG